MPKPVQEKWGEAKDKVRDALDEKKHLPAPVSEGWESFPPLFPCHHLLGSTQAQPEAIFRAVHVHLRYLGFVGSAADVRFPKQDHACSSRSVVGRGCKSVYS